ncbi:MAG: uracil phosphoribosyltransferase [Tepidisphaeraceae bacterium]
MPDAPLPASINIVDHPIIRTKLSRLRSHATSHREFRDLLDEIAMLMTYEVTRDFPTRQVTVDTPLEPTQGFELARNVTLVPVLRAGLGMSDGVLAILPDARVGHLGVYRDETTLEPVPYYQKLPPDIRACEVLVIDPMLATGGSAIASITYLKRAGVTNLRFMCLVAAPAGVHALAAAHPDVPIYCAAVARELNDKGYILPGLGDAGDRVFGTM